MATTASRITWGTSLNGTRMRFCSWNEVMRVPFLAYRNDVWGSARMRACSCRRVGMWQACRRAARMTSPATSEPRRSFTVGPSYRRLCRSLVASASAMPPDLSRLLFGAAEVISEPELAAKVERGGPIRVKLGLDPTAADVTLGWAVVLRKLRQFQDAGHTAVLIVGDFTARVGDPSGKSETRPRLSKEVVQRFAERLLGQFSKVLSDERLEVRYNSEWLEPMDMETVLRLTASYTVARMLERDDFAQRFAEQRPISVMEFLYPLLQAMDSVAVQADVELGGTDQLFNLLVGRDVQREFGKEPQVVLTTPLLEGLDGIQKMSQSLGNYVGITEAPEEMFGKLMSIPDELIVKYLALCTDVPPAEIRAAEEGVSDGSRHPAREKRRMAREVV